MASSQDFMDFVVDQVDPPGAVRYRKMFGEYALYSGEKVIALVCDDRLYMKPTEGGRAYIGRVVEAPPYPGAKPYFLVEDALEDREWLSGLVRITAAEVPEPAPKKAKKPKKPEQKSKMAKPKSKRPKAKPKAPKRSKKSKD